MVSNIGKSIRELHIVIAKRTLKEPRAKDKGQRVQMMLLKVRRQRKKWKEPADAELILNLHFSVKSFSSSSYHADATLEIPTDEGFQYFSVAKGGKTEFHALRCVIEEIERSNWFHQMKARSVYFRVTGTTMEELYKGYL